jgi:hypothetical protein
MTFDVSDSDFEARIRTSVTRRRGQQRHEGRGRRKFIEVPRAVADPRNVK